MISNLDSARSLIAADLEHARSVRDLWDRQVSDLEKALEQMDAVGQSRIALRNEHTGVKTLGAPPITTEKSAKQTGKRGQKAGAAKAGAASSATQKNARAPKKSMKAAAEKPPRANGTNSAVVGKAKNASAAKKAAAPARPKYKDPSSDRTWTGHGRRPLWMTGDPKQYAIAPADSAAATTQPSAAA